MSKSLWLRVLLLLMLVVTASPLNHQAFARTTVVTNTNTIDRTLEPIIIQGADLSAFLDSPVDRLFVYAYRGGTWIQMPGQVDEVTSEGTYTATEDGLLDANDEAVFMAQDLGDRAVGAVPMVDGQIISTRWYEVEVTDPVNPGKKGWAYLVSSSTLTRTFSADYVNFDSFLHRINTASYHLGFATPDPWINYLTFSDGVVNVLDRAPKSRTCIISVICLTEESAPDLQDDLIKDGPVRLIVRDGRVLAYGAMATWTLNVSLPFSVSNIRYSTDFNANASGAMFYNAAVPGGVIVDGTPDDVPETPLSPWWQLSSDKGTLIQVSDTGSIGGNQANYYVDNKARDSSDTGDKKHYGDTGIYIDSPNQSFTYRFTIYILPRSQPNVGETYAAYFSQPLSAIAQLQQLQLPNKVYLPAMTR